MDNQQTILVIGFADAQAKKLKSLFASHQQVVFLPELNMPGACPDRENPIVILRHDQLQSPQFDRWHQDMAATAPVVILSAPRQQAEQVAAACQDVFVRGYIAEPWQRGELHLMLEIARLVHQARSGSIAHGIRLKKMFQQFNLLHRLTRQISEQKPLPALLQEIMESAKIVMQAEESSLCLYDGEDDKLYFHIVTGDKGEILKQHAVAMGQGLTGWVAKHRESLLIHDCYKDPRFNPEYDRRTDFVTRSMVCVPLVHKEKLIGVMEAVNKRGGEPFSSFDLQLFETLAGQCAVAIENARLIEQQVRNETFAREMAYARDIQAKLLPAALPRFTDLEIAACLVPARVVGGDYYHVLPLDERHTLMVVADVAGKSIPAALVVSIVHSVIRSFLVFNPAVCVRELMQTLNRVLIDSTTASTFVTAWLGVFDHDTNRLVSSNAGHNPPFIFSNSAVHGLYKGGIMLGVVPGEYESETVRMYPGDVLLAYTDGLTEAFDAQGTVYGEDRLRREAAKHLHLPAADILHCLDKDVRDYCRSQGLADDLTCLVVKLRHQGD